MSSDRHQALKAWITAILWLIVIALESTSLGAASNTSRILYPLLHFLLGLDPFRFEHWHFFIRKGGHVFGYGMLSLLLFRAWRETLRLPGAANWTLRWANLAVLGTMLVASLDEYHQSFNPLRTGSVRDVILDTCAGLAVQILVFVWVTSSRSRDSLG
ncbi:MAG TPA: VanZ family protein [Candidatus Sulfotelmatobacter sp.]|nr:VanZ family protein [Candidatus Sulfotelmatobacter sp.]